MDYDDYHSHFKSYRDDIRTFLRQGKPASQNINFKDSTMSEPTIMNAAVSSKSSAVGERQALFTFLSTLTSSASNERRLKQLTPFGSSDSSSSCNESEGGDLGTSASGALAQETPAQKSRKGHRKSRQGCFNCKKRKIKCQETQPACENCTRKHIACVYPAPRTLAALKVSAAYSPSPIASFNLRETPTTFSLTDMRLFHHYLLEAYPHLPVGNDVTWVSQVPLIAHHHEYLMHAILGMAASHFELLTGENLQSTAIHHRILAIKGSNQALSRPRRTGSDADALLASCYLIAFQSSYMEDGLQEFLRTIRGCSVISNQLKDENLPMAFFLTPKDHFDVMEKRLINLPVIHEDLVAGAKRSLLATKALCDRPSNLMFYEAILDAIESARRSSVQVYFNWIKVYHTIIQMETDVFDDFVDIQNVAGRVLLAHFFSTEMVFAPIMDREWMGRQRSTPVRIHLSWIHSVSSLLSADNQYLIEWPRAIADSVADELSGKLSVVPKVSILRKREGYSVGIF